MGRPVQNIILNNEGLIVLKNKQSSMFYSKGRLGMTLWELFSENVL